MHSPRNQGAAAAQSGSAQKPNITVYNRLVRDRMPEIIESMGNIAVCQVLDDESFARALLDTLARSTSRFVETQSIEVLADILECIDSWLEVNGLSMEEVERARAERIKRCGTFRRRVFLELVADGDTGRLRDVQC